MSTIFRKQLLLYLGTLAISLTLLGLILSQVIRAYITDQRVETLYESGARVIEVLEQMVNYGIFDTSHLNQEMVAIHQFLNARLVLIDSEFMVLGTSQYLVDSTLPMAHPSLLPIMYGDTVVTYGTLDGLYREPLLTVGQPIWYGDRIIAAVLVGTSMAELENTITEMYRLTLLCLLASALVSGILIYISSKAISKPLRQMNEAARVIAAGDFEKRIPVSSRDEVGQLAETFNHMAVGLQEQERIRRDFVSNLSHDIRSPLTSMRGFLQAINDGTVPEEKVYYYLKIVMGESDRLIKLANNLLDVSKLQETTLNLSIFDINKLIRKTVLSFEPQATAKNLQLHCRFAHEIDMVRADCESIQRVVYNLIDNAVKFVPEGGEIVIETNIKNGAMYVSVHDNGRGINTEDEPHIFDRFFKGDPSRNEYKKGSGLGLSIVKELVKAHGGQITVTSSPTEGCMFTFSLPSKIYKRLG